MAALIHTCAQIARRRHGRSTVRLFHPYGIAPTRKYLTRRTYFHLPQERKGTNETRLVLLSLADIPEVQLEIHHLPFAPRNQSRALLWSNDAQIPSAPNRQRRARNSH